METLKVRFALEYAKRIAYSSEEVLMFTYRMAQKYADTPNSVFCECGVATGAQVIAMAAGAPNKTIYAFDSFEGIPLPSNKDDQMPGLRWLTKEEQNALPNPGEQVLKSSGATAHSLDVFIENLENAGLYSDKIVSIRGWFEDTTSGYPKEHELGSIAILRLDGDLYNSTYVCLKNLYPFVIKGGIVIIDDWALPGCRQAVYDYFEKDLGALILPPMDFIEDENSIVAYWTK